MRAIDLHVHSTCSDGTLTPSQLVDYAAQKGLAAFALTDHDTVDGLEEALTRARLLRKTSDKIPEVIPGIELSTEYHGRDVHIVGLFLDFQKEGFQKKLKDFVDSRTLRNRKMCGLLQEAGIEITYEDLVRAFPESVITRAHYARYMLEHGYIQSLNEAFERYIGDHCPYYVPREKITPAQAIALILEADGIPILAHPMLYHLGDEALKTLIRECKEAGLLGMEVLYPTHTPAEERNLRKLAAEFGLLLSGGSDFHGANKPKLDLGSGYGRLFVPEDLLEAMRASRGKLLFTDMDGTLLNNASGLSQAMKTALDRACAKGHHIILTSGRPLPSIQEVCSLLGLNYPNMLIISNNGALIYDCGRGRPILEERLDLEDVRFLIKEAQEAGLHIHAYTDTEIVCRGINEEIKYYTRRIHLPLKIVDDIAGSLEKGSYKLQCIHLTDRKRLEAFRDRIAPFCGDRIQMIFSNDQYLEILPAGAGKGKAIRFVEEYLHAPHSHTFAAGDAENDISMLQAAHVGIAMANAAPSVKEAADLVTKLDNEHDGLLEILNAYFDAAT